MKACKRGLECACDHEQYVLDKHDGDIRHVAIVNTSSLIPHLNEKFPSCLGKSPRDPNLTGSKNISYDHKWGRGERDRTQE